MGASSDSPLARPNPESKILANDQKKKKEKKKKKKRLVYPKC